ncbi:MAG: ERCC4 domain-containing protein [Nanoarchaeota archaeon]
MREIINIFRKETETHEKPKQEKLRIIADHREKNSLVISELTSLGADVRMEHLEVADFLIKDTAIERKTISDFLSSMISKRLSQQLQNMQQYESKLLLIEGTDEQHLYSENDDGVNPNAIRGFLLDILLKYKVPIIFTKDYKDTAKFLTVLAKKPSEISESLRAKRVSKTTDEQKQFILEGFPGIGAKTAKKLLKEYGSIKNIINSTEDELYHSIGKKSEGIRKLLD